MLLAHVSHAAGDVLDDSVSRIEINQYFICYCNTHTQTNFIKLGLILSQNNNFSKLSVKVAKAT